MIPLFWPSLRCGAGASVSASVGAAVGAAVNVDVGAAAAGRRNLSARSGRSSKRPKNGAHDLTKVLPVSANGQCRCTRGSVAEAALHALLHYSDTASIVIGRRALPIQDAGHTHCVPGRHPRRTPLTPSTAAGHPPPSWGALVVPDYI